MATAAPPRPWRPVRRTPSATGMKAAALASREASRSGGGVDADVGQLAVERGAADAEASGHFRHTAAVMADGQADNVRLDLFQRAQMPFAGEQGHAADAG